MSLTESLPKSPCNYYLSHFDMHVNIYMCAHIGSPNSSCRDTAEACRYYFHGVFLVAPLATEASRSSLIQSRSGIGVEEDGRNGPVA